MPARGRFHALTVADVRPLTDDAIEVTFAVPEELVDDYRYLPGQNVALRARIDGREVRRSYSLCRAPRPGTATGPGEVSVAIKRDPGGRFSAWAHTELHPGTVLDVMSPQGTFTTRLAELEGTHVAGIAAGSGITPLMAVATSVLEASDTSRFTLVYTNRSQTDVMFADELADLKDRFPARLTLHHVLSREQRAAPVLSGRIDEPKLRTILDRLLPPATVDEWFLCGPIELVQLCRDVLEDAGVPREHIRFELFTTGEDHEQPARPVAVRADEPTYALDFTLDGQSNHVDSPLVARESLLTAALRVRPDAPYSCSGGVCGTCRARLVQGSVTMTENYALEPDEIERGYVLTCQSHPTTDRVVVDYDS
ncbi:phenylacetic acid degradation protein [Microbacterium mangrovi]|uniref:Phenylacetic acid degradation protein n=1 Tax=Microbacterium mangrovi TaxID=1348253 RepID=A0A0B2A579_9MICO|nr:1,2-phenylacetyl-CoA epoxidase subunit PaaE [Microbacterium mangrovi]KHK98664.1 phenylacetic acid degradation protein [Microbacterium mangrovi]